MCRAVRANNFIVDQCARREQAYDYARMAYIEENMKLRRGGQQQPALDMYTGTGADKGKASSRHRPPPIRQWVPNQTTTFSTTSTRNMRLSTEHQLDEEGSLANSLAMLCHKLSSPLSIIPGPCCPRLHWLRFSAGSRQRPRASCVVPRE